MFFLSTKNNPRQVWTIRILSWGLLFLSPMAFMYSAISPPWQLMVKVYLHLSLLVVVYYFNLKVLVPRFLFKKQIYSYVAAASGVMIVVGLFNLLTTGLLDLSEVMRQHMLHLAKPPRFPLRHEIFPLLSTILAMDIGVGVGFGSKWRDEEGERKKLESEKLTAELAFLKSQINPHFFFNTMNTIYALIEREPEKAQGALHKLSKLMRYVLYESERDLVPLSRELDFLDGLVELTRIRLPENFEITFERDESLRHVMVPPLLLVPFVENALKHGVSYDSPQPIRMQLQAKGDQLHFQVSNHRVRSGSEDLEKGGGVGLTNVCRRLELLYEPKEYELDIREDDDVFVVDLKIPVQ